MLEHRKLCAAEDNGDLSFLKLAGETGSSLDTRSIPLEKVLSFEHTF